MKQRLLLPLAFLGLLLLPQSARADAGTPLMWAGMLHLAIGNLIIGLGEAYLLSRLYSIPRVKCTWVMILANYFSAWAGGLFLRGAIVSALPLNLNNAWRWCGVMVFVTYFITLVLEWPFVAWCLRGTQDWFSKSLKGNLLIQSGSYLVLFGWYWLASFTSWYTNASILAAEKISLPESVQVFYIDSKDGNVYRRLLCNGQTVRIWELHSTNREDRLIVMPSAPDTNKWDVVARLETRDYRNPRLVRVQTNLTAQAAPDWLQCYKNFTESGNNTFSFGQVPVLPQATNSAWRLQTGFWPCDGISAKNSSNQSSFHLAYETPFGYWVVCNAVQLPKDKVLFQLGEDQICALELPTKHLALLWRGRGPVALMPQQPTPPGQ